MIETHQMFNTKKIILQHSFEYISEWYKLRFITKDGTNLAILIYLYVFISLPEFQIYSQFRMVYTVLGFVICL